MSMKIDLTKKAPTPASAFMDMMGQKAGGDIVKLAISSLRPYPDQPFKVYTSEKLELLAEDIREHGILSPVIVRPLPENGVYQILAGHNRTQAAGLAGLDTVPCIIHDVDDDAAKLILVNSNLQQRDRLLPSEKAFAYKLQLEAIKHQGKQSPLTSGTMCPKSEDEASGTMCQKLTARETVAEQNGESSRNIQNYIRLTYLIPPLLKQVDEDTLPFRAGVNLSYLSEESQQVLFDYCEYNDFKVSLKHSEQLKTIGQERELDEPTLDAVFQAKANTPKKNIRLPMKDIRHYFPSQDEDEIIKKVLEIIRLHYRAG